MAYVRHISLCSAMLALMGTCSPATDTYGMDATPTATARASASLEAATVARTCPPALVRDAPRVVFVIDRSASMGGTVGTTGSTDWDVLRHSIELTANRIDADAQLGAMFFPSDTGGTCGVTREMTLDPASDNAQLLTDVMHRIVPSGGTPLPQALAVVLAETAPTSAESPLFVVVATDGYPNCNTDIATADCLCPDGSACPWSHGLGCLDKASAINEFRALRDHAAATFVLGIASSDDPKVTAALPGLLDAYASAANVDSTGHGHFVDGADATAVSDAIAQNVVPLARCHLHVADGMASPSSDAVLSSGEHSWSQSIDGHAAGWRYTDDARRHVEAIGAACDALVADATLPVLAHASELCAPDVSTPTTGTSAPHGGT